MIFLEVFGKYNVKLDNLDYIELGLWIFLCFILVSGILFFLNRYRKDKSSIFLVFSLEILLFLMARILRIIFKFYMFAIISTITIIIPIIQIAGFVIMILGFKKQ